MLVELTITNFAIIDRLQLKLLPGFNVFTGETGAGKSILIDAVSALLGSRLGADYVRAGTDQARVEGVFLVTEQVGAHPEQLERIRRLLDEYGLDDGEGTVILSREINALGRSVSRINGRAVPVAVLQQTGSLLVDIHGQSEHLSLLRVSEHIDLVDEYAGLHGETARRSGSEPASPTSPHAAMALELANVVNHLRQTRRELQSLLRDERELARRTDLLSFQVSEITTADLVPGEDEALETERRILSNAEVLAATADSAYKALYNGLDEQRSVSDLLGDVSARLGEIARLDPNVLGDVENAESMLAQVEELAHSLRTYRDKIEYDPARLEVIEERLELIRSLKRKYGGSIEEVLKFGEQAADELESLSHGEERLAELQRTESDLLGEVATLAEQLSTLRASAAAELGRKVEAELADLNMPRAKFSVSMERTESSEGVALSDGKRYAFDGTGVDKVEFLVSPNPGEPLKPLAKIASGGETARLMLALKSILATVDRVETLIFDEIDQGIGGRSGQIVGKKLWQLARSHQVICVTHLPQIACFAEAHFSVAKRVIDDRTVTSVSTLRSDDRIDEIIAMLGSVAGSEIARRNAAEMLMEADSWKRQLSLSRIETAQV